MADEQTADVGVDTQAGEGTPAGAMPAQESTAPAGPAGDVGAELERLRAALKTANREAQERRQKLDAYEKAEQQRQESALSEAEKLQKRIADAEARATAAEERARATLMRSAVQVAAVQMRFHDPADAIALADLSGVEIDGDGNVVGVEGALKALAKAKPHLLRQETPPPNINGQARTNSKQTLSDEDLHEQAAIYGVRPEFLRVATMRR